MVVLALEVGALVVVSSSSAIVIWYFLLKLILLCEPDSVRSFEIHLLHFHVPNSSIFKPLILSRFRFGVCAQTHRSASCRQHNFALSLVSPGTNIVIGVVPRASFSSVCRLAHLSMCVSA